MSELVRASVTKSSVSAKAFDNVRWVDFRELHELAQNGKFKLRFRTAEEAFEGLFKGIQVAVLNCKKANVENNDDHVNAEELPHDSVHPSLLLSLEDVQRRCTVRK
jgi:hypothetical protein